MCEWEDMRLYYNTETWVLCGCVCECVYTGPAVWESVCECVCGCLSLCQVMLCWPSATPLLTASHHQPTTLYVSLMSQFNCRPIFSPSSQTESGTFEANCAWRNSCLWKLVFKWEVFNKPHNPGRPTWCSGVSFGDVWTETSLKKRLIWKLQVNKLL